ncbi:hypothetical protein Klosneuvirus_3_64 [Klosneuvirus KNV1]|uniref:Uncharacterized protein n=1 Tax=Klosneuvirus KNV1 TaxID=1977640 RepID=A0A1V0SJN1_9VIRU|nr:hypothetical protein Klosneuvirus_3_64 [Klosneuvirus KNV1]
MKLLFCLVFLSLSLLTLANIDKLSLPNAVHALTLSDEIEKSQNETLKQDYQKLTGMNYSWDQRSQLLDIIMKNSENKSFAAKIAGLLTFQNVVLTLAVLVAVALVVSVAHDLILNKYFLYMVGLGLSVTTMLLKPGQFENPMMDVIFLFDWLTPLFGCLLFGVTAFFMNLDWTNDFEKSSQRRVYRPKTSDSNPFIGVGWFVTLVWTSIAIYQQNWLVGVSAVIILFAVCGFVMGSMFGGYYTGFGGHGQMVRCLVLSVVLNSVMLGFQTKAITGPITNYITIFETGVQFWGTMVGLIAMLILTDEMYIPYSFYKEDKTKYVAYYLFMQTFMGIYCLTTMYFGSIFYISSLKSLGGTFLVLWGLNFERTVLKRLSNGWLTGTLFVVLVNLYGVYKFSQMYPEYWIWG